MKAIKNPTKRAKTRMSVRQSKTRTYQGQPLWALCDGGQEIKWYIDQRSAKIGLNIAHSERVVLRTYVAPENAHNYLKESK